MSLKLVDCFQLPISLLLQLYIIFDISIKVYLDFQMFRMKNTPLDGEILFSRAMRTFRKEMRAQWNNLDSVDSPDGISEQSTLEVTTKS